MFSGIFVAFVLLSPAAPPHVDGKDLLPAVRLEAAGAPIDTEIGHAAPFVGDFDGDGRKDLLVGQFGGGALWIYRNVGTNREPKFDKGFKWQDGGPTGTVPAG